MSLVTSKAIRKQKFVSCDSDISTGPQKTGIIKKHGAMHRINNKAASFINNFITERNIKCQESVSVVKAGNSVITGEKPYRKS